MTIIRLVIIVNSTKHICSGNKHTSTIEILIRTAITITMSSFWLHIIDVSTIVTDKQMSPTDRCPTYTIVLRQTHVTARQMSLAAQCQRQTNVTYRLMSQTDNVTYRLMTQTDNCHRQTNITYR